MRQLQNVQTRAGVLLEIDQRSRAAVNRELLCSHSAPPL